MERLIFRTLPETYAEDLVFSSLRLPDALEPDELADVRQLVHEAVNLAVPKAATCLSQIQDHGDDFVLIDGVRIFRMCVPAAVNWKNGRALCTIRFYSIGRMPLSFFMSALRSAIFFGISENTICLPVISRI